MKKLPLSSSDSWLSSEAELEVRNTAPSPVTRSFSWMSKGGIGVPPFTRVSAPERQESSTSSRNAAADPRTSCSSSASSRRDPPRCSAPASAWPE